MNNALDNQKLCIFRDSPATFSPISTFCSNSSTIVIFRENNAVELFDVNTLKLFYRADVGSTALFSTFTSDKDVVFSTSTGVFCLCIKTGKMRCIKRNDSYRISQGGSSALFYNKNEVFNGEFRGIFRCKTDIRAVFNSTRHCFIISCEDKTVRLVEDGRSQAEFTTVGVATAFCEFETEEGLFYTYVDSEGFLYLFGKKWVVLDKIRARETRLNCLAFLGGVLHVSGLDSRILSFSIVDGRFVKCAQVSVHTDEVLGLKVIDRKLFSVSKDSLLVRYEFLGDKYRSLRVFEQSLLVFNQSTENDQNNDLFAVVNDKSLNLYKIEAPDDYNFYLKFNFDFKSLVLSADISPSFAYFAVSTKHETLLYSIHRGSSLCIEKVSKFGSSSCVKFLGEKFLFMVQQGGSVEMFDLDEFTAVDSEKNNFQRATGPRSVVRGNSDCFYVFEVGSSGMLVVKGGSVQKAELGFSYVDSVVSGQEVWVYGLKDGKGFVKELSRQKMVEFGHVLCSGIFVANGKIYLYNSRFLYLLGEGGAYDTYDLEFAIHACVCLKTNNFLVVQTNWDKISRSISSNNLFKEKYRNK